MLGSANNQSTAEDGAMGSIQQNEAIDKLPVEELRDELALFLQPVLRRLPEKWTTRRSSAR
jgi:hypothetical protein